MRARCRGHDGRSAASRIRLARMIKGQDPVSGKRIGEPWMLSKAAARNDSPVGASCSWEEVHGFVVLEQAMGIG